MEDNCDLSAPGWQLSVFGGPVLARDGEAVNLTPYQNALLALVACSGSAVQRAQLVNVFYGVPDEHSYRRRLSQLIYSINRRCGFYILEGTHDVVCLNEVIRIDLVRLAAEQSDLTPVSCKPLTRIRPPFPSMAFESWLLQKRGDLAELARGINAETLELAWNEGDLKRAREAAHRLLESLPTHSRAIKILFKVLTIQEGRASAMAWLARYREQHLGAEHRADDSAAGRHFVGFEPFPEDADRLRESSELPFIGRSSELLEVLSFVLDSNVDWRGIFIQGEAGSGKSRFLRELERRLAPENCVVAAVKLRAGDSFAVFSLLRLLLESSALCDVASTFSREDRSVLATAVGRQAGVVVETPPLQFVEGRQQQLFRVLSNLVDAVNARLVFMVDDVRFADQASLAALGHLRRKKSNFPVCFICTDRGGRPEAAVRMAMICELLALHNIVDLLPLPSEQARQLARHVSNTKLSRFHSLERVVQLSGGNPLFLVELARIYADAGSIDATVDLPQTLEKLIADTIGGLEPNTRALLKVLAVQLGTVSLETLSAVSEMTRHDLLVSMDEANRANLLSCAQDGVSFRHGLMQEWLYRSLAPMERRFLHSATALYLGTSDPDRSPDLAFHFHRAGENDAAARASLAAAEDALQRGACSDAIAFLEIAIDTTSSDSERFSLLDRLSRLYSLQGNLHESLTRAASALELRNASSDQAAIWRLEIRRATAAAELGTVAPDVLHRKFAIVLDEAGDAPDSWVSALDAAVTLANSTLEDSRARALLKELDARHFSDPRIKCRASLLKTFHLAHGSQSVATAASDEAISIARANGYEDLLMKAVSRAVIVRSWQATLKDAQIDEWKAEVTRVAERTGDIRGVWSFQINVATWLLDTFRIDEAYQWIQQARVIASGSFDTVMDIGLENNLGEYYLLKSDFPSALEHYQRAVVAPDSMRRAIHLSASAGLGYCLIAQGLIREALEVDADLPSNDEIVQIQAFDPSNLLLFRARLLSVRSRLDAALSLVGEARCKLEHRHLPAWFKLGRLEVRLLRRRDDKIGLKQSVAEIIEKADELHLSQIAGHFKATSQL